jgi:hypothetical protein
MSDSVSSAVSTPASPAAAPAAPANASDTSPAAEAPSAAPAEPAPRVPRKAAKEARRANPNHDAEMWARAGQKAAAKEAARKGEAPAKAEGGAPAKDPETGRFLPRDGAKAEGDAPAKTEPSTDKAQPVEKSEALAEPTTREAKAEKLKALAAELGYKLDAGAVTAAERYQLRAERREMLAKVDKARNDGMAELERARQAIAEESKQSQAFMAALKSGDPDAMAQAAGHKDWNSLQEALLEAVSDPHYARIKALEAEREAEKKEREEAKQRFQAQQQAQARQQAHAELVQGVTHQAKGSSDPLLKACADDPLFIKTLISRQEHHYDPVTETTCSLEEALDDVLPNGQTLRAIMRSQYERLGAVFGAPKAPEPAQRPAPVAAAPAPVAPRAEARPAPAPKRPHTGAKRPAHADDLISKYAAIMEGR